MSSNDWIALPQRSRKRRVGSIHERSEVTLNSHSIIEVDGSYLEGGGQICRVSLACAAILKKAIRITNIRAGRPKPGLRNQHLSGAKLLAKICHGRLENAKVQSTTLEFFPKSKDIFFSVEDEVVCDMNTPGAISLVLQAVLPVILFLENPKEIKLKILGGTDVPFSPPMSYLVKVMLPLLKLFVNGSLYSTRHTNHTNKICSLKHPVAFINIIKRGFNPTGGGIVKIAICPLLRPLFPVVALETGGIMKIDIKTLSWGCSAVQGEQMQRKVIDKTLLYIKNIDGLNEDVTIFVSPIEASVLPDRKGKKIKCGISLLVTITTAIGTKIAGQKVFDHMKIPQRRNKQQKQDAIDFLTEGQVTKLVETSTRCIHQTLHPNAACIDEYAQDQVLIFAALASGLSAFRVGPVTKHTQTAIYNLQHITGAQFRILNIPINQIDANEAVSSVPETKETRLLVQKLVALNGSGYVIMCNGIGLKEISKSKTLMNTSIKTTSYTKLQDQKSETLVHKKQNENSIQNKSNDITASTSKSKRPTHFVSIRMNDPDLQTEILSERPDLSSTFINTSELHITLALCTLECIQNIESAKNAISAALADSEIPKVFQLNFQGRFGKNVIFAKCMDDKNLQSVISLSNSISSRFAAANIGLFGDGKFQPHMTIAKMSKYKAKSNKKKQRKQKPKGYSQKLVQIIESKMTNISNIAQVIAGIELLSMEKDKTTGYYKTLRQWQFPLVEENP